MFGANKMKSSKQLLGNSKKHRKWPRDTFTLLSKHITGVAMDSQNYVDWAVLALIDGFDTPSLAILAGLDLGYSYSGERYDYFRRSIKELGIDILNCGENILVEFSGFVCKGLLLGEIDAGEAISILGSYYVWSYYSEPFFLIWYTLSDEIDLVNAGYGSIYGNNVNKSNQNEYIKKVAEQYLALLEIPLPDVFFRSSICDRCGFFGEFPIWKGVLICPMCKSKDALPMRNSYVGREKYLLGLEQCENKILYSANQETTHKEKHQITLKRQLPPAFNINENEIDNIKKASSRIAIGLGLLFLFYYFTLKTNNLGLIAFFIISIFLIFDGLREIVDNASVYRKKQAWIKNAVRAQVPVVDRTVEYDDYAETLEAYSNCELAVKHSSPTVNSAHNQIIWARVSDRIYHKYKSRDFVYILYDSQNPYLFIIEDE